MFTNQVTLLFNINFCFDCKTRLCLIVPCSQGQYIFTQESFYLQGTLSDINEQDTSFLDCKYKHMMKSGAPPDKILHILLHIEFHGFANRIDFQGLISKGYHSFVPDLISIF